MNRIYTFGPEKTLVNHQIESFARECIRFLGPGSSVVRLERPDEADRFSNYKAIYPLWLFPLMIEREMIAIFVIEGGNPNDFQKIEVLASQLALQVKKVQLYETVKQISIIDGLTQVFVRRHFFERFQEEMKRAFP